MAKRKMLTLYIKGGGQLTLPLMSMQELIERNTEQKKLTRKVKETIPDAGQNCFFVACAKLGIYTSIGADNIHHASNKATKLFGSHWSMIRPYENPSDLRGYQVVKYLEFKDLIKTLQI